MLIDKLRSDQALNDSEQQDLKKPANYLLDLLFQWVFASITTFRSRQTAFGATQHRCVSIV